MPFVVCVACAKRVQIDRRAMTVPARQLDERVSRDIDDDAVLACALAGRAQFIVSGDDDLLVFGAFKGIPIITVATAVRRFGDIG